MLRTFFAFPINESLRAAMTGIQHRFSRIFHDCRWVNPDLMHLTVKFIGDTDEACVSDWTAALRPELETLSPMTLRIDRTGIFPDRGPARVLWAGPSHIPSELKDRLAKIDTLIGRVSGLPPAQSLIPHLTLGRPKSGLDKSHRDQYIHYDFAPVDCALDRIIWYESKRMSGQLVYEPLEDITLKG